MESQVSHVGPVEITGDIASTFEAFQSAAAAKRAAGDSELFELASHCVVFATPTSNQRQGFTPNLWQGAFVVLGNELVLGDYRSHELS